MSPHPPEKARMSESNRKNRTTTGETTVNQVVEFGNGGTRCIEAAPFANQLQHTHLFGEFHTHPVGLSGILSNYKCGKPW